MKLKTGLGVFYVIWTYSTAPGACLELTPP